MLARHNDPTLVVVVAVATAAAVSGDNVSYWMGRPAGEVACSTPTAA